jgi:hypothetical protein
MLRVSITIFFVGCILGSGFLYSQNSKIDSLKSAVNNSKGINKYDPLIELVIICASVDNSLALHYAETAYKLSYQFGDSVKIVHSSRLMGQLLNRLSRPKEAEQLLVRTIGVARRNNCRADYKIMMNNLALAYTYQAMYDKALTMNLMTLSLRQQDNEVSETSISLTNIGLIY